MSGLVIGALVGVSFGTGLVIMGSELSKISDAIFSVETNRFWMNIRLLTLSTVCGAVCGALVETIATSLGQVGQN